MMKNAFFILSKPNNWLSIPIVLTFIVITIIGSEIFYQHIVGEYLRPIPAPPYTLSYLEDLNGSLTIDNIVRLKDNFYSLLDNKFDLTSSQSALWLQITSVNYPQMREQWLLKISKSNLNLVSQYTLDNNGPREIHNDVTSSLFKNSELAHHNNLIVLPDNISQNKSFFIRVSNAKDLQFNVNLIPAVEVIDNDNEKLFWLGIYYGILLGLSLYTIVLFFSIKDKLALWYLFYFLSLFLFSNGFNHVDSMFWGGRSEILSEWFHHIGEFFLYLLIIKFSEKFLCVGRSMRKFKLIFNYLIKILLFSVPITLFLDIHTSLVIVHISALAIYPIILYINLVYWIKGTRRINLFKLSFVAFFSTLCIHSLNELGIINDSFHFSIEIFSLINLVFLHLEIRAKLGRMHQNKINSQHQLTEIQSQNSILADKFVPKKMLEILDKTDIKNLGIGQAVSKKMTIMFINISFTSQADRQSDSPKNIFAINKLLQDLDPVIAQFGGLVDKYIWEEMMVIFPNSPGSAVSAGVQIHKVLDEFNKKNRDTSSEFKLNIGVHYGDIMFGTIGTNERMDISVISKDVNLTSRIKSFATLLDAGLLISEDCVVQIGLLTNNIRPLGKLMIRGKCEPVQVFEVLDVYDTAQKTLRLDDISGFQAGIQNLRKCDFSTAKKCFDQLLGNNPEDLTAQYFHKLCDRKQYEYI